MKLKEKFSWIREYLSIELLYLTIAVVSYLVYAYINKSMEFQEFIRIHLFKAVTDNPEAQHYYRSLVRYSFSFIGLFVIPFISLWIIQGKSFFKNSGLTLGNKKLGFTLTIPALVFMWIAVVVVIKVFPSFIAYYPMAGYGVTSLRLFLLYEAAYFSFFIGWEFFFHSFLVFPYEAKLGKVGAIIIGTLPFVIVHIGKPFPEVLGSFVANVFLCMLALETRSFWYGFALHSMVAIFMEFASVFFKNGMSFRLWGM